MAGVAIVVFSDLVDSTALLAQLGDDRMDEVRRAHVQDVTGVVSASGGRIIKTLGDGAMASFESALGALRAAAGIQSSVERLDAAQGHIGIAARVGVAAGEPIPDGDDLHGMAVVIAARLCSAAETSEVLVQDLVASLVASRDALSLEELQSYELKGVPLPVRAAGLRWRELAAADAARAALAAEEIAGDAAQAPASEAPMADPRPPDGVPLPRMLAAYAQEPLIGREREVGLLREATSAKVGRRAALLLGEPGIGKTRHAAAAASEAHTRGAVVALARCPPEANIAFEPWVRAIGELARVGADGWRSELARAAGPELAALVPELRGYAAVSETVGAGEIAAAEGARYRLLNGIGAALGYAAGDAPLYVVVDDAHWCDPASAQALSHLLENAPSEQLVLIVTARERELGRGHPVSRVLSDLRRTRDLTELRLEGLDAGGLAALVAARVGRAITPRLAARLQARTAGNPFFAAELALDLDERGALREGEELDATPVPDAVTDLVEERLGRLDPNTERLLAAAAAIGPSARVSLAARAAGLSEQDAQRAIQEALTERLVDEVASARPTIVFPHAVIREALTASSDAAGRARLHLAIAEALEEDPDAEPAELARHFGLAVAIAGPARAIASYQTAGLAAAEKHDHEQAAAQVRSALNLIPPTDLSARAPLLLELGEQRLLAADLPLAREAFRAAGDAARSIDDTNSLALAALGYAGGDIAFGYETGSDDPSTQVLLREGLEALGDDDPRLALRMIFRLALSLGVTDDDEVFPALVRHARALDGRLDDTESHVLARYVELYGHMCRGPDPLRVLDGWPKQFIELAAVAEGCDRQDLLFRAVQGCAYSHWTLGQVAECDQAIARAAEIAERLGSPRFTWEIDADRASRMIDQGDRAGAEARLHRAGATLRRLRPDLQMVVELAALLQIRWIYDGETAAARGVWEALEVAVPQGVLSAVITLGAALDGDHETARRRLASLHAEGLEELRRPDMPRALGAVLPGAGGDAHRRPRGWRAAAPAARADAAICGSDRADRCSSAISSSGTSAVLKRWQASSRRPWASCALRSARADDLGFVWLSGWARVDLAVALHRRGDPGDHEESLPVLAEGEQIAERYAMRWVQKQAAIARAELEGRPQPAPAPTGERARPVRALAARTGRRALAAMVRGQDDQALERRFSDPRRQRALLRAGARGFQPAHSDGFCGVIAYELEPFAIDVAIRCPLAMGDRSGLGGGSRTAARARPPRGRGDNPRGPGRVGSRVRRGGERHYCNGRWALQR